MRCTLYGDETDVRVTSIKTGRKLKKNWFYNTKLTPKCVAAKQR